MIYKLMKSLIEKGHYEKEDMLNKMNVFLLFNQIAEEEYTELAVMISEDEE